MKAQNRCRTSERAERKEEREKYQQATKRQAQESNQDVWYHRKHLLLPHICKLGFERDNVLVKRAP